MNNLTILMNYHQVEVAQALRIVTDLKNMGWPVFMDRLDIRAEQDWMELHEDMIDGCSVLLVLLSPDCIASKHCQRVFQVVQLRRAPIIPLLLRPISPQDWPSALPYQGMVDFSTGEAAYPQRLQELAERLSALGIKPAPFVRPEVRMLNQVMSHIELSRSRLEYVRLSHQTYPGDRTEPLISPPTFVPHWGLQGPFIYRGVLNQERRFIGDLREFARQHPRFVLMGEQGVGKTTSLFRLVTEAVQAYHRDPRHAPLPCLAFLGTWDAALNVDDFLAPYWPLRLSPTQEARQGKVSFFLDGLNELAEPSDLQRQSLVQWLATLPQTTQVVITCDADHLDWALALGLPILSLEALPDSTSEAMLHGALFGAALNQFWAACGAYQAHWRRLLRFPLLFRLALFVHRHSPQAKLPPQVGHLFTSALELLWQREQLLQNADWLSLDDVKMQLARLAFDSIQEGRGHYVTQAYAHNFFQPSSGYAGALSAGLLELRADKVSFVHASFTDVLAAWYIQHHETPHAYLRRPLFDDQGRRVAQCWDRALCALATLQEDADGLLRDMADVDPFLACRAVEMGALCNTDALNYILERAVLLAYECDSATWQSFYEALVGLTDGMLVSALLHLMRHGDSQARYAALSLLLYFRNWGAWHFPTDLLDQLAVDADLLAQWRHQPDEVLPALFALLLTPDYPHKLAVVQALTELADESALPALLAALHQTDDIPLRLALVGALGALRSSDVVPVLIEQLEYSDVALRRAAVLALKSMGVSALPALIALMSAEAVVTRRIAAGALGMIGDLSALPYLIDGLKDLSPDVRAMCATALGQIAHPLAIKPLAAVLSDAAQPSWVEQTVGEIALRALEKIGGDAAMNVIKRWQEYLARKNQAKPQPPPSGSAPKAKDRIQQDLSKRPARPEPVSPPAPAPDPAPLDENDDLPTSPYLPLLPDSDEPSGIQGLLQRLQHSDIHARHQAAQQIVAYVKARRGRLGAELDVLFATLESADPFQRWVAVEALAWLKDERTLPALLNALHDSAWMVRTMAIQALGELGDVRAVPYLLMNLHDPHDLVREACVEVLGRLRSTDSVEALLSLIQTISDDDSALQLIVIYSLSQIADPRALPVLEQYLQLDAQDERMQAAQVAIDLIQLSSASS